MRGAGRPKSPVSRADLAARKGVTPGAVTKQCHPGGALHAAVLEGGDVDLAHPATKAWLRNEGRKRGARPKAEAPAEPVEPVEDDGEGEPGDDPEDAEPVEDWDPLESPEQLAGLPYEEARRRYAITLQQWVDASKRVAETEKVRVAVAQKRGQLISRELVADYIFGALDALSLRLLRDAARTIGVDVYIVGQRGGTREEAIALAREHLESQLTPVKDSIVRSLEAATERSKGDA